MSLIQVSNLTFAYDGSYENIFENASFQIDTNWRLGFTGRNGRGKTTFLNLLLGKYEYQGSISASVSFSYFPYHVADKTIFAIDVVEEIYPEYQYSVKDNYSNMIGHPDCRIFIADCDGQPVGFLCALIYRFPMYRKPVVILDALFVEEPYRHNGYATKLIMELKHFAQEMGASAIELKVFSENATANSLYIAHGFAETKKYLKWNMELAELEERT